MYDMFGSLELINHRFMISLQGLCRQSIGPWPLIGAYICNNGKFKYHFVTANRRFCPRHHCTLCPIAPPPFALPKEWK